MEQLNNDINLLIGKKVNFNVWDSVYNKFIEFSQCGRLTLVEIKNGINILLNSIVVCETIPEEKKLELQKIKLNVLVEYKFKELGTAVDSIRRIKEYKNFLSNINNSFIYEDVRSK